MGDDPKTSVLNRWSQAHEVPNLLVVDAAPFNGNPDKNVTLTIVANAWRSAGYATAELTLGREAAFVSSGTRVAASNEFAVTGATRADHDASAGSRTTCSRHGPAIGRRSSW